MLTCAIVGHPNAGKTTLFNTLTRQNATVGNWHGVTVKEQTAKFKIRGRDCIAVDLPGFYSLAVVDDEEIVTKEFLLSEKYQAIIFVVEAKKVKRAEDLILSIKKLNKNTVVFVNGYAEFTARGGSIDLERMQGELGLPVVLGEAFDKKCVDKIIEKLQSPKTSIGRVKGREYFFPQKNKKRFFDFVFNKFLALPFFALTMAFTFWFCFGKMSPISLLSCCISRLFDNCIVKILKFAIKDFLSPFLCGLIFDGIFVGVSSVLEFLPQICALSLCMNFLNQSGFFSRFSAVLDDFLSRFGLSGKSLYSLVSGFGCTAVAVSSLVAIKNDKLRKRVALSLPAVSCSAKTPVYVYLAKRVFNDDCYLIILAIYFLSILLPLLNCVLLNKTVLKGETENYTSEIADMRIPAFKPLLKSLQKTAIQFIIKIGTVILISSALVWILKSVSFDLKFVSESEIEKSILCSVGKSLSFLFYPIGIKNWRYAVGALVGLFAKEGIVSTLSLLQTPTYALAFPSKIAFIIFCYAYSPCVSALGVYKKEFGFKFALTCAVYWLIGGFLLSYLTYFTLNL